MQAGLPVNSCRHACLTLIYVHPSPQITVSVWMAYAANDESSCGMQYDHRMHGRVCLICYPTVGVGCVVIRAHRHGHHGAFALDSLLAACLAFANPKP